MNVQSAANLNIPEGSVRNIHDKDKRLLWSAVGYNVRYDGDTTQQTYTGKNLSPTLNNYTWYGYHTNGLTVTNSSVTAITSSEYSSTGAYISKNEFPSICPALGQTGNVVSCTISLDIASNVRIGYEGTTSGTFVKDSLPAGKTRVSFATEEAVHSISFYVTSRTGATIVISEFQVEAGSTATSYEPYVGGVPAPNPDYPQDVNVVKGEQNILVSAKNLLSVSFAAVGGVPYDIPTNTFILDRVDQRFFRCDFPTLLPPGTYTISFDISNNNTLSGVSFNIFNKSETSISGAYNLSGSHYSGTFTFNESVKIIRWFIASNESNDKHVTISNVQVEAGSTATSYEMYQGQQTFPVDLGSTELCKIGNYQDYIYKGADGWYVHKETGKVVLDGDENVSVVGTQISGNNRFFVDGPDDMITNTDTEIKGFLYSDMFIELTNAQSFAGTTQGMLVRANGSKQFAINYYGVTTGSQFKTWLSTNNVTIYYALATPTNTKITDNTLIGQLNAVHDWLRRYDYYGNVTGNLPMIINRTGLT